MVLNPFVSSSSSATQGVLEVREKDKKKEASFLTLFKLDEPSPCCN